MPVAGYGPKLRMTKSGQTTEQGQSHISNHWPLLSPPLDSLVSLRAITRVGVMALSLVMPDSSR